MKYDIKKAVEVIKSAGMEEFLHQDPSNFHCEDCPSSQNDCKCPKTKCICIKKFTFVSRCTRVRVRKWTFVTKRIREKKCKLVKKCIRFDKQCYWTKKCICKKNISFHEYDNKPNRT
ncbi:hypothetical protein DN406_32875 [Bacillus sp. BB56-3]|nr:hypothetical protein DN406_32875 [Bacillus sp. BB56-3]